MSSIQCQEGGGGGVARVFKLFQRHKMEGPVRICACIYANTRGERPVFDHL